jgi:hypothetical protein
MDNARYRIIAKKIKENGKERERIIKCKLKKEGGKEQSKCNKESELKKDIEFEDKRRGAGNDGQEIGKHI